jgi:hypothetical protein
MMADLLLANQLNLKGNLKLVASSGGLLKVNGVEALVEVPRGQAGQSHGLAPAPVPIPPPPAAPLEPGLDVWIFKSFNATVTINDKKIITQGMCAQGDPGKASWPGMVQQSLNNPGVKINGIPINVRGDMGVILPTGAPVFFDQHRQQN